MKKNFTLLLFALLGYSGISHACSCIYIPTFCETITYGNNGQIADYLSVYAGTVSAATDSEIELLVQETYFGEFNTGQTIRLAKGFGADCVLELSNFAVGDTYIIAANKHENTWRLSACGITFLKVQNGEVIGPIAPGVSRVSLAEFVSEANCGNLTGGNGLGFLLKVNPTLTSGDVNISTSLEVAVPIQVTVFDAAGRLVHQAKESAFTENKPIVLDMEAWAAGMYFVRMDLLGQRKTVKVVKVGAR
ncbi:MAG: T9SS type A sorting domain-containing protein [Saprospiraceae bacterium]|nr:T9SS type A sorting domain-containing protein [Saprospiraceae bacterium]